MTKPRQQRKVRFNEQAEVCETLHILDYTPEEKEATFITFQELMEIKRNVRETVHLMNDGEKEILSDTELYCTRGLESLTRAGNLTKKSHKIVARRAVLLEQSQQVAYKQCIFNPEYLANISTQATERSRIAARVAGIMDAEAAAIAAGRSTTSFPVKPMEVEMARPEVFVRPLSQRVSLVSQAA